VQDPGRAGQVIEYVEDAWRPVGPWSY